MNRFGFYLQVKPLAAAFLLSGCAYSPVIYRPGLVEQQDLQRSAVTAAPPINLVLTTRRTTYHSQSAPWHFQVVSGGKIRRALAEIIDLALRAF